GGVDELERGLLTHGAGLDAHRFLLDRYLDRWSAPDADLVPGVRPRHASGRVRLGRGPAHASACAITDRPIRSEPEDVAEEIRHRGRVVVSEDSERGPE